MLYIIKDDGRYFPKAVKSVEIKPIRDTFLSQNSAEVINVNQ